ncbi:MAG: peptidase S8 [Candidatus Baltobacteraceae bacterium]
MFSWRVHFVAGLLLCGVAACSNSASRPGALPVITNQTRHAVDTATGLPGDTATGLPGDTATGLPGDTATGLPGDTATGLPGAQFACSPASAPAQARCTMAINITIAPLSNPNALPTVIPGFQPRDLVSAYDFPTGGGGKTVAIVAAFDDPAAESDLAVYRSTFGLPGCTSLGGCFRKVNQAGVSGNYPVSNAGWTSEISLDLDMVSAVCPNCSVVLVEANSANMDDLGAAVDTAAASGAIAVSNSYYAPEWSDELSEEGHYHHPGIAITASSGDTPYPGYPAASKYIMAVGGTTLSRSGNAWNEQPWRYSGRGCSKYIAKPDWQHGWCRSTRQTVDVAADADPSTGVAVYDTVAGGWIVAGGTSVGAPLLAGAYALAGNGAAVSFSYAHAAAFHDILPIGYDLWSGLGSPYGVTGL